MIQRDERLYLALTASPMRGLSEATRQAHPDVPWSKIAGTRDRVIHGYFNVDLEIIWEIVETELPTLREKIAKLLPQR